MDDTSAPRRVAARCLNALRSAGGLLIFSAVALFGDLPKLLGAERNGS